MSATVLSMTDRHAAIRDAINARARAVGATEDQRRAAVSAGLAAYRNGSSAAASIAQGQSKLPRRHVYGGSGHGPRPAA